MQTTIEEEFVAAVRQAEGSLEARAAVHAIYASLAIEIAARRPVCDASGKCCRFDGYGHRLYVTTLELGVFARDLSESHRSPSPPPRLQLPQFPTADACVFQTGNLCGVHDIRPFGCRMFYCDPTATVWQNDSYERYHCELKQLRGRLGIPYLYVEWRWAIDVLKLGERSSASRSNPDRDLSAREGS